MAHTDFSEGPRVGKYRVDLTESERVISTALNSALDSASWIVLDEVGPMELKIASFEPLVYKILESDKPVILTFKEKLQGKLMNEIRQKCEVKVLTMENREEMLNFLVEEMSGLDRE